MKKFSLQLLLKRNSTFFPRISSISYFWFVQSIVWKEFFYLSSKLIIHSMRWTKILLSHAQGLHSFKINKTFHLQLKQCFVQIFHAIFLTYIYRTGAIAQNMLIIIYEIHLWAIWNFSIHQINQILSYHQSKIKHNVNNMLWLKYGNMLEKTNWSMYIEKN